MSQTNILFFNIKVGTRMGSKGELTKQLILEKAYELFAVKGFTQVTMKDICDKTGLSRGGLYRHYENTDHIFEEIIKGFSDGSIDNINEKMNRGIKADIILDEIFSVLEEEMLNKKDSLSLAIYEYAVTRKSDLFEKINDIGRKKWQRLLNYGMERGEFIKTNPEPIIDLLLYSYQGVQMWSNVTDISRSQISEMLQKIKEMLR
ncbi:TetR/AcrR family transcriptional regulator [Lacrimispora amygdalina]|uniref:TetR/AcrR family transcriptional regulator n=2 Tax=Lacrimispora amygdalina TaxID=253257 RepID=A0A3E2N8F1_9FIRM|nr:TetR/AcrR family transcriptional regulator [Clostridium indicum]